MRAAPEFSELHAEAGIATADVEQSIPARFEQQVAQHGSRKAIACGKWQPTYAELNAAANHVAHALLARGGARGDRVVVLMRHDGPLIAALLAVLKAGRILVVLNPADPPARLKQVLSDAEPALFLVDWRNRAPAGKIAAKNCPVICFDDHFSEKPSPNPAIAVAPDDLATLIYTSGSAGRPKGVIGTHRAFLHQVFRSSRGMAMRPGDRLTLLSSLNGSLGLEAVGCALLNGAALCPFPLMEKGVTDLGNWMVKHRISVYFSAASVFRHFMKSFLEDHRFSGVRLMRIDSETSSVADFARYQRHFPGDCVLMQTYDLSEAGNICQMHWKNGDCPSSGPQAVGSSAEGVEVLLLDDGGAEIKGCGTGEIAVRSRYLSSGYWRNAPLTEKVFSKCSGADDVWVCRSGDLGSRDAAGLLTIVGRLDVQERKSRSRSLVNVRPRTKMERRIASIWEEVLRCQEPSVYDSFLELGGDSLLALGLVLRLMQEFGGNEKDWLSLLLRTPTIAQMAEAADNLHLVRPKREPWFRRLNAELIPMRESGGAQPFVFIPGGYITESELLVCAGLLPHLNTSRPAYGIRLNLFAGRVVPPLSVGGIARKIVRALCESGQFADAPVLVGECVACALAFETAKVLERRHGKPPRLILLDPFLPPIEAPVGQVRTSEPTALRRYLRLLRNYRPSTFRGKVHLVCCEEPGRAEICLEWWRRFLPGGCHVHVVPGDHHTYIRRHQKQLAEVLNAICDAAS